LERVFCYLFTTSEGDIQEAVMGKGGVGGVSAAAAASINKSVPLAGLGAWHHRLPAVLGEGYGVV